MMRQGGSFLNWMERGFALHRGWSEADNARRSRERAEELEDAMATAEPSGAFGDGRLGNLEDCKKAGLLNSTGLFLGAFGAFGHFIFHNGEESLLTYNRAGGGKGTTLIQPNLAHSNDRTLIVVDAKDGELAFSSAAHRRDTLGTEVIYFNPYGLHGYPNTNVNPLFRLIEVVETGGSPDGEAEAIFEIVMPAPARDGDNAWVRKGAIQLCSLRAEYLAHELREQCTLPDVWKFLHGDDEHFAMEFSMMASSSIESIARRAQAFASMRVNAEKQWEAIRSEAASAQVRVRGAIKRMNERFEKCEPALTQARYRDLLTKQGASPELKPSYATENPQDRMWRAAKQWVRYDHQGRVNKIREVGDKMMSKDRGLER